MSRRPAAIFYEPATGREYGRDHYGVPSEHEREHGRYSTKTKRRGGDHIPVLGEVTDCRHDLENIHRLGRVVHPAVLREVEILIESAQHLKTHIEEGLGLGLHETSSEEDNDHLRGQMTMEDDLLEETTPWLDEENPYGSSVTYGEEDGNTIGGRRTPTKYYHTTSDGNTRKGVMVAERHRQQQGREHEETEQLIPPRRGGGGAGQQRRPRRSDGLNDLPSNRTTNSGGGNSNVQQPLQPTSSSSRRGSRTASAASSQLPSRDTSPAPDNTLRAVSRKYGVSVRDLRRYNTNLASFEADEELPEGTIVKLKATKETVEAAANGSNRRDPSTLHGEPPAAPQPPSRQSTTGGSHDISSSLMDASQHSQTDVSNPVASSSSFHNQQQQHHQRRPATSTTATSYYEEQNHDHHPSRHLPAHHHSPTPREPRQANKSNSTPIVAGVNNSKVNDNPAAVTAPSNSIPYTSQAPPSPRSYDTIQSIAEMHRITPQALIQANPHILKQYSLDEELPSRIQLVIPSAY